MNIVIIIAAVMAFILLVYLCYVLFNGGGKI